MRDGELEDRDALYYPFIHLRNEAWLRSALLFFPHVIRMIPPGYDLADSPFVRDLAATPGRRGEPLVGTYPLNLPSAYQAGFRLAQRMESDLADEVFRARYSRDATLAQYGRDDVFQIHQHKFAEELARALGDAGLLWPPSQRHRGAWFAVHPVIGDIVISTAAVAAASDIGCDVLTDTPRDHRAVSTRDEEAVYRTLLGRDERGPEQRPEPLAIGNLVIATTFDLSDLKPADFAAISGEREALFDFRRLLAEHAAAIPTVGDAAARHARAKEAAEMIIEAWEGKRATWKGFMKRLFRLDAAKEAQDAATKLLEASSPVLSGTVTTAALAPALGSTLLAVAPGLAVGFGLYGISTWSGLRAEERFAPTRFLSLVKQNGGVLSAACAPAS